MINFPGCADSRRTDNVLIGLAQKLRANVDQTRGEQPTMDHPGAQMGLSGKQLFVHKASSADKTKLEDKVELRK